ncbi:MAG: glycosyltransferase [Lachnospiraceae bacterium]|nr:glycosyltransferase [Lachnospiraceae bacterium]
MIKLLINATGSSNWIGGLYHKKNILFSLLSNEWIRENCRIVLVTNPENRDVFADFGDKVKIKTITYKNVRIQKIKIALLMVLYGCDYVFPNIDSRICTKLHATGINWMPDYQHYYYPEYFTESDIQDRKQADIAAVESGYPLVLSSHACLDDFRKYVSKTKENVFVVPFVSYIEKEVRALTDEYVRKVCEKYGTDPGGYIMVANQFWKHKNHTVVFEAIKTIAGKTAGDIKVLFTGKVDDYRDSDYADRMKQYLSDPTISDSCICSGFIDRKEQLALMKGARFLIQPSMFEGWGTVLEDAKVLDKTVILSDIPVHREQMHDKSIIFKPDDPDELAKLIIDNWSTQETNTDDISRGIDRMRREAKEYSMGMEELLKYAE